MILYSHFSASKTSDPLPRLLSAPSQHWGLCGWSERPAEPWDSAVFQAAALAFLRALHQLDHSNLAHFPGGTRIQPLGWERAPGAQRWGDCRGGREDCRSTAPRAEFRTGDLLPATAHCPGVWGSLRGHH